MPPKPKRKGSADEVLTVLQDQSAAKKPNQAVLDYEKGFPTAHMTCLGENCRFNGYQSGFCSQCWKKLSPEDRVRHTDEQIKLQPERDRIKKEQDEAARIEKERIAREEEEERRKENERLRKEFEEKEKIAAEKAAARAVEIQKRKDAHLCYPISTLSETPTELYYWSCGVHDHNEFSTEELAAKHLHHKESNWLETSARVAELTAVLDGLIEPGGIDDFSWSASYVAVEQLKEAQVLDTDSTDIAVRKALKIASWVPIPPATKLSHDAKSFWELPCYNKNAKNRKKVATATDLMKQLCVPESLIHVSYRRPDASAYPVVVAGRAPTGALVMCHVFMERGCDAFGRLI